LRWWAVKVGERNGRPEGDTRESMYAIYRHGNRVESVETYPGSKNKGVRGNA
jgi:hypothetical protein